MFANLVDISLGHQFLSRHWISNTEITQGKRKRKSLSKANLIVLSTKICYICKATNTAAWHFCAFPQTANILGFREFCGCSLTVLLWTAIIKREGNRALYGYLKEEERSKHSSTIDHGENQSISSRKYGKCVTF